MWKFAPGGPYSCTDQMMEIDELAAVGVGGDGGFAGDVPPPGSTCTLTTNCEPGSVKSIPVSH